MDHKTHDALVSDWKENAPKYDDENYEFVRSLKQRSGQKVDRIALKLHQEAFSIIECTKCANCCRTLKPMFTEEDIARISGHLGMARTDFLAAYLEEGEHDVRHRTKTTPCPFLGEDNRCTIYAVRPKTCQDYPYTDQPDFTFSSIARANSALVCPAVFFIIEQMKNELG